MGGILFFLLGLVFTCLAVYIVRHFIIEMGESLYQAMLKGETVILVILALACFIMFIIIYTI
ncbi:MAG: hypothetical protein QNI92_14755 [Desulfobacterales bacterium]|nr:hypothetical protein [Desulfobacterales bacterium]MDJ0913517.1 hypothetical protein [Desulfobacterales bacterium]